MASFKEQLERLTVLKHQLAVWELLHAHLDSNYVPRDAGGPQKAIRVSDCLVELVPPEVIEEVMQELTSGPMAELQEAIKKIESMDVDTKGVPSS
jgi:hypothetical protein